MYKFYKIFNLYIFIVRCSNLCEKKTIDEIRMSEEKKNKLEEKEVVLIKVDMLFNLDLMYNDSNENILSFATSNHTLSDDCFGVNNETSEERKLLNENHSEQASKDCIQKTTSIETSQNPNLYFLSEEIPEFDISLLDDNNMAVTMNKSDNTHDGDCCVDLYNPVKSYAGSLKNNDRNSGYLSFDSQQQDQKSIRELTVPSALNKNTCSKSNCKLCQNVFSEKFENIFISTRLICFKNITPVDHEAETVILKISNDMFNIIKKNITQIGKTYRNYYIRRLEDIKYVHYLIFALRGKQYCINVEFKKKLEAIFSSVLQSLNLTKHDDVKYFNPANSLRFLNNLAKEMHLQEVFIFVNTFIYNSLASKQVNLLIILEYLKLFKYFTELPELITLDRLLTRKRNERILVYICFLNYLINQNKFRLQIIRKVVILCIKNLFKYFRIFQVRDIIYNNRIMIDKNVLLHMKCKTIHSEFIYAFLFEIYSLRKANILYREDVSKTNYFKLSKKIISDINVVFDLFMYQLMIYFLSFNRDETKLKTFLSLSNSQLKRTECFGCLLRSVFNLFRR